jgi:hypothetical protein
MVWMDTVQYAVQQGYGGSGWMAIASDARLPQVAGCVPEKHDQVVQAGGQERRRCCGKE